MNQDLESRLERWKEWLNSEEGERQTKEFFENIEREEVLLENQMERFQFLFYESAVIEAYNECVSQTQHSWIPVEVRNPIVSGRYFLTIKVDDSIFTVKALFNRYKNKWICIGEPLAWQPITIPEPYNPQTDK